MSVRLHHPSITLIERPSEPQLHTFWDAFFSDATTPSAYMEPVPQSLSAFLEPVVAQTTRLWLVAADGNIAGAHWLHDIQLCGAKSSGWTAGYFLPAYRGLLGASSLQQTNQAALALNIPHLFCAIRQGNVASTRFVEKAGYHQVTSFPNFCRFDGQADTVHLFSLRDDDANLLLDQAAARSHQHWDLQLSSPT